MVIKQETVDVTLAFDENKQTKLANVKERKDERMFDGDCYLIVIVIVSLLQKEIKSSSFTTTKIAWFHAKIQKSLVFVKTQPSSTCHHFSWD